MTPELWQNIKPILEDALDLAPAERFDFLKRTCGDNAELIGEVESLLALEAVDMLDRPAFSMVPAGELPNSISYIGKQIGRYRILSELGTGGMGVVFLAERSDGEFQQQVALKLIKAGIGSASILRRFVSERQILASLHHHNIAHLLDGGTTDDGLPYLVMEYVNGESIIEYAANRDLSIEECLDLFREVCAAVSFAHQNLIIHRDLKPFNIIVNAEGSPKLLDFGIAKLLKVDNSGNTATQHVALTPEYASPEQIRGENLTTATDIYSLGVILYELLARTRPFSYQDKTFAQILHTATATEPVKPSSSAHTESRDGILPERHNRRRTNALKGDLDNIVLKALKKEPDRRYVTVDQFSEDIRLFLKGLPVTARQDTWRYRAEKFTRRSPLLVGFTVLTLLILIAGVSATAYQAGRANTERKKAEQRFNEVRTLANSFIFEVNDKIAESPIKARELLVKRSVEYLDKLAAESDGDMGLQAELAAAYEKIGDVQAEHFGSGTGDTAGALENHRKALKIRERLSLATPDDPQHSLDLARSYLNIADLSVTAGNTRVALETYDKAVLTIESVNEHNPGEAKVKQELARSYAKLGQGILRSGSISRSLENYEKAIVLMKEISAANPENLRLRHDVSVYQQYAGYAESEMGRTDSASTRFLDAFRVDEQIWLTDRESFENRRNLSTVQLWYGTSLRNQGRFDEGRSHQVKALDIQQQLFDIDRSDIGSMNSLADCFLELGWTISDSGKAAESLSYFEKAIALYETVAKTDASNLAARRQVTFTRIHLAEALARSGNITAAKQTYQKALTESENVNLKDGKNSEFRHDLAVCHLRLADLRSNALPNLTQAIQILEILVTESPEHKRRISDLAVAKTLIAKLS